jgi:peptide/nickel transport system permease protein
MNNLKRYLRDLLHYPSAVAGVIVIALLLILSIYTLFAIPYPEAVRLWRGGEDVWYRNPKQVPPAWFNYFTKKKQPLSFSIDSESGQATKTATVNAQGTNEITITYTFDYQYDDFPQEMILYFDSVYTSSQPFVSVVWLTPDGREIKITELGLREAVTYRFSQDDRLSRMMGGQDPVKVLLADPDAPTPTPLKGTYRLVVTGYTTDPGSDVRAEFVLHGKVYGLAGTDHMRRDLLIALLWGTPIALAFGLLAAIGTSLTTMLIAALGVWYGGWIDEAIQRITEVNLVLPQLPILIMIGTFYSRSIWLILGATVILGIFGGGIKTYRAMFMQVKEAPFIEAARTYGANDMRIIFRYLAPRLIPTLIPQLVTLIPSYVFLEASLAVLGLGDPVLPTWGKIINDARANGALYEGLYYWVLEPAVLLMVAGLAFALLGFALDRIFNPRLRGM